MEDVTSISSLPKLAPVPVDSTESEVSEEVNRLKSLINKIHRILVIHSVSLMAIGGIVFGIGILLRPFLRLISFDHVWMVSIASDCLILGGVFQIGVAGFSSFTAICGLTSPIYMGIHLILCLTVFELSSICLAIYLQTQGGVFPSEAIHQAWWAWECEGNGSCHEAYFFYLYAYMCPQVLFTLVAIGLQLSSVRLLYRLVKGMKKRKECMLSVIENLQRRRENLEETRL